MNVLWQSILSLEFLIQALSKVGLNTHCLQNENAHSDHSLLGWVSLVFNGIEKAENDKIVRAIRIDHKRPESFIAL